MTRALTSTPGSEIADIVPSMRGVRAVLSQTPLRIPVLWFRHRGIRPQDVLLGSYPRSGSTWLRFTLFEALTGRPSDFLSVNSNFRPVGQHFNAPGLLPAGGRLIGTHERYRAVYHRAIYLVRDVRDVALSQYLREKQEGETSSSFDEYLRGLLTGPKRHGCWPEHVLSWLNCGLGPHSLLVVRYENLRWDPERVFSDILNFLGVSTDAATVRRAIDNNSVPRMRAKEDDLKQMVGVSIPNRPVSGSNENGRFIRQGRVGGWRDELTEEQTSLVEKYAGEALLRMGYPLTHTKS